MTVIPPSRFKSHTRAVNWAFAELHTRGLVHRAGGPVNWCPALGSAISDVEVDLVPLEGRRSLRVPGHDRPAEFGVMHDIAYKVDSSGGLSEEEELVVSTTRPETLLGDTTSSSSWLEPPLLSTL